jgi:hypothetical protein
MHDKGIKHARSEPIHITAQCLVASWEGAENSSIPCNHLCIRCWLLRRCESLLETGTGLVQYCLQH